MGINFLINKLGRTAIKMAMNKNDKYKKTDKLNIISMLIITFLLN